MTAQEEFAQGLLEMGATDVSVTETSLSFTWRGKSFHLQGGSDGWGPMEMFFSVSIERPGPWPV